MAVIAYNDPRHNLPTPDEIRTNWCFGLPLYAKQATQWTKAGQVMSDEDLQVFIDSATKEVERRLGVFLKPTIIKCEQAAYSQGLVEGVDYDVVEPPYDYAYDQYQNWGFLTLRQYPYLSIEGFKMILPNGQQVIDFAQNELGGLPPNPSSWIKTYKEVGQVRVVPYAGSPSVLSVAGWAGSSAYPMFMGTWDRDVPQTFWVDYTAGFALGKVPYDVRNVVAKIAASDALGIAGEALLAGVASQSIGMDGLSQSFSTTASAENTTYGAHITQYKKDVLEFFNEGGGGGTTQNGGARTYYKGFNFTVL